MLYFYNDGEIDIRAVTTMGVSAKDSSNPIGFFGTGLKYSIAIILRLGGKITIYSGLEKYDFIAKPSTIRGKEFSIVYMNDRELGFTTDLGKTWQSWMVFRELYCNAKDENGDISLRKILPASDKTVIVVNCQEIENAYNNRFEFLIGDRRLFSSTNDLEIYQKIDNNASLFYRGIKVISSPKNTLYDYNLLLPLKLTEDRTVDSWSYEYHLRNNMAEISDNTEVIENILIAPHDYFESKFDFSVCMLPSKQFLDVIENLIDSPSYGRINKSAIKLYYENRKKNESYKSEKLSNYEQDMIDKAKKILEYNGYNVNKYNIICVTSLGLDILGQADSKQKIIYIAKEAFIRGLRTLVGTIYEEYIHISFGYQDESRSFQNHLIDTLAGKFEQVYKEGNYELNLSNSHDTSKNLFTEFKDSVPF